MPIMLGDSRRLMIQSAYLGKRMAFHICSHWH